MALCHHQHHNYLLLREYSHGRIFLHSSVRNIVNTKLFEGREVQYLLTTFFDDILEDLRDPWGSDLCCCLKLSYLVKLKRKRVLTLYGSLIKSVRDKVFVPWEFWTNSCSKR